MAIQLGFGRKVKSVGDSGYDPARDFQGAISGATAGYQMPEVSWSDARGLTDEVSPIIQGLEQQNLARTLDDSNAVNNPFVVGLLDKAMKDLGYGDDTTPTTTATTGTGGSGVNLAALQKFYNERMQGVRDLFAGYGQSLATAYSDAGARMAEANRAAQEAIGAINPTNYTYTPAVVNVPLAAGSEYLRRTGAPTAGVDAARALGQQILQTQMASAGKYSNVLSQAQEADIKNRLAAAYIAGSQGVSGLEANRAAMAAAIEAGRAKQLGELQEDLLTTQLKYGV